MAMFQHTQFIVATRETFNPSAQSKPNWVFSSFNFFPFFNIFYTYETSNDFYLVFWVVLLLRYMRKMKKLFFRQLKNDFSSVAPVDCFVVVALLHSPRFFSHYLSDPINRIILAHALIKDYRKNTNTIIIWSNKKVHKLFKQNAWKYYLFGNKSHVLLGVSHRRDDQHQTTE